MKGGCLNAGGSKQMTMEQQARETLIELGMAKCSDCKLEFRGCVRQEAHREGRGCQGFESVLGIGIVMDADQPETKAYRVVAQAGDVPLSVDVWKDKAITGMPVAQEQWRPATVNWSCRGNLPPEYAHLYGKMLVMAAELAERLERLVK